MTRRTNPTQMRHESVEPRAKRLIRSGCVTLLATLLLTACSQADRDAGFAAYNSDDYKTAFQNLEPFARKGDAEAQFHVAVMYESGNGVQYDYYKASDWYRSAADQGHANAQLGFATIKDCSSGRQECYVSDYAAIPEDCSSNRQECYVSYYGAQHFYRKAANQGLVTAQYNLGYLIERGLVTAESDGEAAMWYQKASAQEDQAAEEAFARYKQVMDERIRQDEELRLAWCNRKFSGDDLTRCLNKNKKQSHDEQVTVAKEATFRFTKGTAEWFSPKGAFSEEADLGARYLIIKGELKNTDKAEVMEGVQCVAQLTVVFENGKTVEIESEDICSDAGIFAAAEKFGGTNYGALVSLLLAPGKSHTIDTSEGGWITSTLRGPTVPGKFKPYPVQSTRLTISLTAKTAFGDPVQQTIFDSVIMNPSHNAKFNL